MGRNRTCRNLFQGQASYRLLDHAQEPGGGLEPPTFALRGRCSGQLSYPGLLSEPRARFELAPARYDVAAVPLEFYEGDLGVDWEAGHDPAPPAWKASTLPAYATPSFIGSGWHDSNVPKFRESSTALEAVAAADFATPGGFGELEPSARVERAASHVPGERSCLC